MMTKIQRLILAARKRIHRNIQTKCPWPWISDKQPYFILAAGDGDVVIILTTSMSRSKGTISNNQQLTWNSRATSIQLEWQEFDQFLAFLFSIPLTPRAQFALLLIVPSEDISRKQNRICLLSLYYVMEVIVAW